MSKRRLISQFMWGYQYLLRSSLKHGAKSALDAIGFRVEPTVVLIGFQAAGEHAYSICIDPETGPYEPSTFSGVEAKAQALYKQAPDRNMHHSDPGMHRTFHRRLQNQMRRRAITEALEGHPASIGQTFFVGGPTRVGDYNVYPAIGVPANELQAVPQLSTIVRDRFRIHPSIVHAVIDEVLYRAGMNLFVPDAGADLDVLGIGTPDLVRIATGKFVHCMLLCAGSLSGHDHDLLFNAISALPYEGRSGVARLVLAAPESGDVETMLVLSTPIDLTNARATRKLMEASGPGADLLVHEGRVYGLGRIGTNYDRTKETAFVVSILGRGAWDLYHGERPLLSTRDGASHLPINVLKTSAIEDLADRLLESPDVPRLIELAKAASQNDHGAMLVVSSEAAAEARRLSPQAWAVDPMPMTPSFIQQLTSMDGAVLVDPQGNCHAIGVILDGHAAGQGDPARGSRFNNAIRYLDSNPPAAIVVVYSTDGTIDVLPDLMPRVKQEEVLAGVQRFLALAAARPPDFEQVYNAWEIVKSFKFYLSQEQCNSLNACRQELEDWRMQTSHMKVEGGELSPDPRMDATYWKTE